MGAEFKSGNIKAETRIAKTLHDKLKRKLKKQNVSVAQCLRDMIQAFVKK